MGQITEDQAVSPATLAKYVDLFERLIDTALLVDPDSMTILDANAAAERSLGTQKEDLLGASVLDWIPQAQRETLNQAARIAKRRYYPRQIRLSFQMRDGSGTFPAELAICSLDLANGKTAVQLIGKDITREVAAEEAAKQYLAQLESANQKLEMLAVTDEMTQLANFRHFKNRLQSEHERSSRYQSPYSIIFCDIDNFKHYNDTNGHPAGDKLLKEFAKTIKGAVRTTDLAARYGGEEFVILCPETDREGALVLAQRILETIIQTPFENASKQPLGFLSFSGGVASYPADATESADVLKAADLGVYHSKHSGRAQITPFDRVPESVKAAAPAETKKE